MMRGASQELIGSTLDTHDSTGFEKGIRLLMWEVKLVMLEYGLLEKLILELKSLFKIDLV